MKEKINYKSKRAIIIGITCVALFALVAIGTVLYIKGNNDTKATSNNESSSNIAIDDSSNSNTESNSKSEGKNSDNKNEKTDANTTIDENGENQSNNVNNDNTENGNKANNNEENSDEITGTNSRTGTTTVLDDSDGSASTTYTQTGETVERKISDEFLVSWTPIAVNAITEQINKPELEIKKKSFINNEKEEDTDIHTAVVAKDYITYKISVKNNSDVDAKNIHIYDNVPKGTKFIEIYDEGTEKDGKLTWIKDIKSKEEVIVSFRVQVKSKKKNEEKEINQIDNIATVDGNETNETHNPIITFNKEVKVISTEGEELDNQIVTPGTRLKYYINLKNSSEYDGTTIVTDNLPEGTTLIDGTISNDGEYDSDKKVITWKNVEVKAGKTVKLSFDVTVNKGTRNTVSNKAKVGPEKPITPETPTNPENPDQPTNPEDPTNPENPEQPDEPDDPQYTNEVKTPVLLAEKTSVQDGATVHEKNVITYNIKITNTANPEDEEEKDFVGTAKLIDKFWNGKKIENKEEAEAGTAEIEENNTYELGDDVKVKFVRGSIKINGEETNKTEDFLKNIEVELKAGEVVNIEYKYKVKEITAEEGEDKIVYTIPDEGEVTDIIRNNLYWKNPEKGDPSRPENPNDITNYGNPEREGDPTKPEKDPNDDDNTDKDVEHPIDTVIVNVLEVYKKQETKKIWKDFNNSLQTRPESLKFKLFADGKEVKDAEQVLEKNENEWKITFKKLKKFLPDGKTEIKYTIKEDKLTNYQEPKVNDYEITNIYEKPEVEMTKDVKVILNNSEEAKNQAVIPGTRLKYYIKVENKKDSKAVVKITDKIPEGTLIYKENGKEVISDDGVLNGDTITWDNFVLEGKETRRVSFDVTVKKNQDKVVENTAKVYPKDPENPDEDPEPQTSTVRTPVFVASKESSQDTYGIKKTDDGYVIDYVVKVTNTGDPKKGDVAGTAKLIDKYWVDDTAKMEFLRGSITIKDETTRITNKNDIEKIVVKNLEAGETAKIKYTFKYVYESVDNKTHIPHDEQDTSLQQEGVTDGIIKIRNNLYWYNTSNTEESRQDNPKEPSIPGNEDTTSYGENHTKPTPDPKDTDNSNKDPQDPIDTVEVKTQYTSTEITKIWEDNNSENRPNTLSLVLKGNGREKTFRVKLEEDLTDLNHDDVIVNKEDNNTWKIKFIRLAKYEDSTDGKGNTEAKYTVTENVPTGYNVEYSKDKNTITNIVKLTSRKTVEVVNNDGSLSANKTIMPGTRLRYTVFIVNNTDTAKYVDITDNVPEGTTLYQVLDNGTASSNKDKVEWKKKKVLSRDIIAVRFDVTVNKNNKSTIENQAKFEEVNSDGSEKENGDKDNTNKVRTPVFTASKTSDQDGKNVKKETDSKGNVSYVIDYTIEVKNSGAKSDVNLAKENKEKVEKDSDYAKIDSSKMNYTTDLAGTAKLVDKFWIDDKAKVEVVSAKLKIGDNESNITDLENIEIKDLKVGEKAKITIRVKYLYEDVLKNAPYTTEQLNADKNIKSTLDKIPNGTDTESIKIRNNLYWMNTTNNSDPSRPENPDEDSSSKYGNTTSGDPTKPTKDSKDNEETKYDSKDPIDTVEVEVEYTNLIITKVWNDNFNVNRPNEITLRIYDQDVSTSNNTELDKLTPYRTVTVKLAKNKDTYTSDDGTITANKVYNSSKKCYEWTITVNKLLKYKENGTTPITYMIREDELPAYNVISYDNGGKQTSSGLKVTNATIEDTPLDVVFVLDISSSMFTNPSTQNTDFDNNRLKNMVNSINQSIETLMTNPKNNNKNRVAIQLFNTESHELLPLGHYTKKDKNTAYLTYNKIDTKYIGASVTANAKEISAKTVNVYKAQDLSDKAGEKLDWKCGTYTQLGIQDGGKLFKSDPSVTRKPVMILVTDGDPTHYDTQYTNVRKVTSGYTKPANKVPQVAVCASDYYYYTMRTIDYTKNKVSKINNYEDCSFYTIGIDMYGSMAKMLLNPNKLSNGNYVNLNNIEIYSTVSNVTNKPESANPIDPNDKNALLERNYTLYKDPEFKNKYNKNKDANYNGNLYLKNEEYYIYETERLNKKLKNISLSNYSDGSYKNNSTTLTAQLTEIINNNRLVELKDLDSSKYFSLLVNVDGTIKINTQSISNAINNGYIKLKDSKYYFDFSNIPTGNNIDIKIQYYEK